MVDSHNAAPRYAQWSLQTTGLRAAIEQEPFDPNVPAYPTLRSLVALASCDCSNEIPQTAYDQAPKNQASSNKQSLPMNTLAQFNVAADCNGYLDQNRNNGSSIYDGSHDAGNAEHMFRMELGRIRRLVASRSEQQWQQLIHIIQDLPPVSDRLGSPELEASVEYRTHKSLSRCNTLGSDSAALERFVIQSASAIADLAQLRDTAHRVGYQQSSTKDGVTVSDPNLIKSKEIYAACVREILSVGLKTNAILVGLSDMYEHLRHLVPDPEAELVSLEASGDSRFDSSMPVQSRGEAANYGEAEARDSGFPRANGIKTGDAWVPPDQFRRKTTKFWVRQCDIPTIQAEIVRHLPILIFDRRRQDHVTEEGGRKGALQQLDDKKTTASSRVTSVYYDNVNIFSTYGRRLRKEDGAQLVRVRWYGARSEGSPGASQKMWVERKTHREPWAGTQSIKERGNLEQQHLGAFAQGVTGLPGTTGDKRQPQLLREVQHFLTSTSQEPVLRTQCSRAAFQNSDSANVRVSIDTNLRFTRETKQNRGDAWCRSEAVPVDNGASHVFPYAIVEIKIQEGQGSPIWIHNLRNSSKLLEVASFSKFLHASATLYPSQVASVGVPYWFLPSGGHSVSPATFEEMAATENVAEGAESRMFPSSEQLDRFSRVSRLLYSAQGTSAERNHMESHRGPVDPQTVCSLGEGNDSVLTSHLANNTVPPSDLSSNVPDRSDLSQKPQAPSQVTSQTATCYTHFDAESAPTSAGRNVHGTTAAAGSLSDSPWQGLEAPKAFYLSASGADSAQSSVSLCQPGSAPAKIGASAVADSAFHPLWRTPPPATPMRVRSFSDPPRLSYATSPGDTWASSTVTSPEDTHRPSPQPLLRAHPQSVDQALPLIGLSSLRVSGRSHSSTCAEPSDRRKQSLRSQYCCDNASWGTENVKSDVGAPPSFAPTGNSSIETTQQPVIINSQACARAALPSPATLDALEAMESGRLCVSSPPTGSSDRQDTRGSRTHRWRSWRMPPFRKKWNGEKGDRTNRTRPRAIVRTRVEPKTFFANERTFLSWLQISVLIMFMGLTLLGNSGTPLMGGSAATSSTTLPTEQRSSQIAGLIIAPVAFVFTLYALFMYKKRTSQILRREAVRYDDQTGPVILVVLLSAALIATTAITARSAAF